MKNPIQFTNLIELVIDARNRWSWRRSFLLIPLAVGFACLALAPGSRAVSPPPDGGYVNANTAEGEDALFSLDTGNQFALGNTAIGYHALFSSTDAQVNTAIGVQALESNISGSANVAVGAGALSDNVDGWYNTAVGQSALGLNTTGGGNTAIGTESLEANTTGSGNTAVGNTALILSTGSYNTGIGSGALFGNFSVQNSPGNYNTATGYQVLYNYTTGSSNTASGYQALYSLSTGDNNTATGVSALYGNTTGVNNVANGVNALKSNTTGVSNTATGVSALLSSTFGNSNTAVGISALAFNTTGGANIGLGQSAGINLTTGSNNIDIGNAGVAGDAKKIRIGTAATHSNTYIAGIYGVTVSRGIGVIVDSTGHLGTSTSSARFKQAIKPMDKASEGIHALKPVTFRYKQELDPEGIPQFGLVAEDVEKVNPDLVARDEQGKPYAVRYEAVNAMLLNEFLKEHRKVEEQEAAITELRSRMAQQRKDFQSTASEQQKEINVLTARLREQASQIQRVIRTRVEVSKPISQMVADSQ